MEDNSRVQLDLQPEHRLNDLQSAWNKDGRCYEEKSGEIEVGGRQYQFKVSFLNLRGDETSSSFSTLRRAITEVAPNLGRDARHDIVVPVLPGFGETTAQFEGDFLNLVLEALQESGFKNPKVLGINTLGKGTPEYVQDESRGRISTIGMMDGINDSANIANVLAARGYFGNRGFLPNVAVMGHSMGSLDAISFMDVLNYGEGPGRRNRSEDLKVRKFLSMMPAVDGSFAMVRARFLWAVRKQVFDSVKQAVSGRGAISLSKEDHHRIMFGDENFRDEEQFERGLPDSARRFLQLTLNGRRRLGHVFEKDGTGDGVDLTVWKGGQDRLIPDNAITDLPEFVGRNGSENKTEIVELPDLSHSIPFRLRDAQRDQVKAALGKFFS